MNFHDMFIHRFSFGYVFRTINLKTLISIRHIENVLSRMKNFRNCKYIVWINCKLLFVKFTWISTELTTDPSAINPNGPPRMSFECSVRGYGTLPQPVTLSVFRVGTEKCDGTRSKVRSGRASNMYAGPSHARPSSELQTSFVLLNSCTLI